MRLLFKTLMDLDISIRNRMNCRDYRELIAAHVDGVLSLEENRAAQSHVERCSTCRRLWVWEAKAQGFIKPQLATIAPPPQVREKIFDNLVRKCRRTANPGWFWSSPRLAGSFALLVLVVLGTLLWRHSAQDDLLRLAVDHYTAVVAKGPEAPPPDLSAPAARQMDLSPWGYRLTANQVKQVNGREQRLSLFEGQAHYVLAQEFDDAGGAALPDAAGTPVEDREFVSYSRRGVNLVAWKDKDLLCVLTSKLPNEKLLALAKQVAARG